MKFIELNAKTETDKVLKSFINRYFASTKVDAQRSGTSRAMIELFLKASCGSNCSYCYLHNHRNELYPMELENDELILSNLSAFLDMYIENKWCNNFEIFSGRIFDKPFGLKVFELIYNKFRDSQYKPSEIIIPDDMQFILDSDQTTKIERYLEQFKDIGIYVYFSASVDGKLLDYERFGNRVDEFYYRLKDFCLKHNFCYHPMVSAHVIDKWIDNFDWWYNYVDGDLDKIMFLQVRNGDWTEARVKSYLKLLDHVYNVIYDHYSNKDDFFAEIAGLKPYNGEGPEVFRLNKLIELKPVRKSNKLSCALQNSMVVRMADLAIVPCHRTGYKQFTAGFFIKENDEIVGIKANNAPLMIAIQNLTLENMLKCNTCSINKYCMGPCLGANFEYTQELFYAPDDVCFLFKCGILFTLYKLNLSGGIKYLLENYRTETLELYGALFSYMSHIQKEATKGVGKVVLDTMNELGLELPKKMED